MSKTMVPDHMVEVTSRRNGRSLIIKAFPFKEAQEPIDFLGGDFVLRRNHLLLPLGERRLLLDLPAAGQHWPRCCLLRNAHPLRGVRPSFHGQ